MPFDALWGTALVHLQAQDLAQVAAVSSSLHAGVVDVARRALEPTVVGGAEWQPPARFGWAKALYYATEWPRMLVLGGEDSRDEPQLHVSLVSFASTQRAAYHQVLPSTSALPSGRYRPGVACIGSTMYVTGGVGPEGSACMDVLRMDMFSHEWQDSSYIKDMPRARTGHESVSVLGRYLLCVGGKAAEDTRGSDVDIGSSTDCLDTASGLWISLPCRLHHARVNFGAAAVGNFVVVCGGAALENTRHLEGRLSSTEVLDITELPALFDSDRASSLSFSWRQGPSLSFPRYDFSLAGPIGKLLFAVGGSGARRLVEVLDVSRLDELGNVERQQASVSATEVREELLSAGWIDVHTRAPICAWTGSGIKKADGEASPKTSQCQASPVWVLHPIELPESRNGAHVVAIPNGLCLVGGSQRSLLKYNLGEPSWEEVGAHLDSMRLGAKAVVLGCFQNCTM